MAQKKRQQPDSAAETLDAIEGFGDRIVHAVTENPTPILATAVGILVVAAVFGLTRDFSDSGASESAAALARVQAQYRTAMGGNPGSLEVPEPANPETAERLRVVVRIEEYGRLLGIGDGEIRNFHVHLLDMFGPYF